MGGEKLKAVIEAMLRKHWPKSTWRVEYKDEGRNGVPSTDSSVFIMFTLFEKKDWPNGYMQNDPAWHHIWIWGPDHPRKKVELSTGGSISIVDHEGPLAFKRIKAGWRNATGDDKKIIRTLDAYFGTKLKRVVEAHKDELDAQRQSNRQRPNIKWSRMARITRRANQDLRAGLIRLAHDNPELRKDLLPLLAGEQGC